MKIIFYLFYLLLFVACSSSPVPKEFIQPDKMQRVVLDLMTADDFLNNYLQKDTSINLKERRSLLYEQVFKVHGTNRKGFYTSYKYYEQRPDIQKALYDSLNQFITRRKELKYQKKVLKK